MGITLRLSSSPILALAVILLGVSAIAAEPSEEKEAVAAFKKAMTSSGDRSRIRAVNELAAVEGKSVSKLLRKVVGSDRSEHVRAAAAQALGKRGDRKDLSFLMGALKRLKKMPIALAGAIDGIAEYGERKSGKEIFDTGRYWMAKHKYPVQAAIRCLGRIRSKESVEYLLKLYDYTYPGPGYLRDPSVPPTGAGPTSDETSAALSEYRPFIESSLRRLTGESIGDREAWHDWWDDVERDFDLTKVVDDVNSTLLLTDDEFGFSITRPSARWAWTELPETGFTRTARRKEDDQVQATLSILVYSTDRRTPDRAEVMLGRLKKGLLERFEVVAEQKWDEAVKVDGIDAIRQTIAGTAGGESLKIQLTVFVHRRIMHVIRITCDKWASRTAVESAEKFLDSFHFL